jgi:hypothetical protein
VYWVIGNWKVYWVIGNWKVYWVLGKSWKVDRGPSTAVQVWEEGERWAET